ncbi:DNA polymerase III subunit delta' [Dysosmobacter sp.]|jgi:DNA polymerase-3 subunit delta'|uniref:DNA polymerase III subunit delta' n=1 Tax=Dysosmobacter sp. TaxID=2591382 RepID=UPI002671CD06|nr:DNA polymerase III subunit delta' [Dysosmobacter sp.]MCI6938043.1 DNA polymerase III subunit delta' [Clostridiales bacterium]MCI6016598.1 DNA polymerase III subunit delta' [Dysosmobacter sp.]MCI7214014.1 DNA polymerase III subunit delta' [Dysosmobacter sp.]MCI7281192.1 DNA polymerase III subunit delta' [Dysosmobacter sp.]MDY3653586.1 DNA polymerase III subunit delta' [Dysosmobacter sp.]
MEFANDPIAQRIREAAGRGTLSHALLFSGSGDRIAAAQYAAAAMECQGGGQKPCGTCPACRKVFSGIHPDVITVRDEAHKNLSVDTVRQIRADAYIRPNEGARKVYIFPDCTILTEQDQNVLLKIVEEGPPYAAFLFCAENSSMVLQTLRSRCVELKLHPAVTVEKESSEAGVELCRLLAAGKRGTVTELMVRLEKKRLDRDGLAAMLDQARTLLAAALLAQYGQSPEGPDAALIVQLGKRLTKQRIMGTIELLQTYRGACSYNVGASHVLGALAVELEEIL